jgi:hypothetical protein
MWFLLMVDPCSRYMWAVTERMSPGYCSAGGITENDLPGRMDAAGQAVAMVSDLEYRDAWEARWHDIENIQE